ncbi:MAG: hypothetical protein EHM28_13880, partial [Spirochaetaceae bacterium]
ISGGFGVSVQGQATAIHDIMEAVANVPGNKGLGAFYREPDWIPVSGAGWVIGFEGDMISGDWGKYDDAVLNLE